MKVLVTIAEIAEVGEDFQISGTSIDERHLEYDLNEWDDYAIEEAVQLREDLGDVEVIGVTIGPQRSEETMRMALAKGVDRAIRVWDSGLEDIDLIDVELKTAILEKIVFDEEPDIVFSGVQASDDSFGATGVSLAEATGYEWAAVVNKFDYDPDQRIATVHRELEGGVAEVTEVETPAIFTIQTGINEPRYASLRGIRQAQAKEIAVKSLEDLDVDVSTFDLLELREMYVPQAESDATIFEGGAADTASQLAGLLRDEGVGQS